jgi:hypothetical protein
MENIVIEKVMVSDKPTTTGVTRTAKFEACMSVEIDNDTYLSFNVPLKLEVCMIESRPDSYFLYPATCDKRVYVMDTTTKESTTSMPSFTQQTREFCVDMDIHLNDGKKIKFPIDFSLSEEIVKSHLTDNTVSEMYGAGKKVYDTSDLLRGHNRRYMLYGRAKRGELIK